MKSLPCLDNSRNIPITLTEHTGAAVRIYQLDNANPAIATTARRRHFCCHIKNNKARAHDWSSK
jgi:hypothetical protein